MRKIRKPGQIFVLRGLWLRVKKRENGCEGCVLNKPLLCPRAVKNPPADPDCIEDNIIFTPY
jgi:hypothetical protein